LGLVQRKVMVMERMHGTPISQIDALRAQGVDIPQALARAGVEIFFTQVFRDGFFHADMHPGNIFVCTDGPRKGYIALDFGIMGTLNDSDKNYLAQNFLAFFKRDYKRVAEAHIESGWAPARTPASTSSRRRSAPSANRSSTSPLKDISLRRVLLRLFQTSRRFNVEIQPQLVLLQKTLLNIEGLGRELDPELDLWQTAKPYLERWMNEQLGCCALERNIKPRGAELGRPVPAAAAPGAPGADRHRRHQSAQHPSWKALPPKCAPRASLLLVCPGAIAAGALAWSSRLFLRVTTHAIKRGVRRAHLYFCCAPDAPDRPLRCCSGSSSLYLMVSVGIGLFAATRVHNAKDFAVAGRRLPLPVVTATVFATWFGAEAVFGVSATFVKDGLGGVVSDPFGSSMCLIIAGLIFSRYLYKLNLLTLGDFYRMRYNRTVEVLTTICIVLSYLGWVAAQIKALGLMFYVVTDGAVSQEAGMILGAAIVLSYTMFGGMFSVAILDFVQMAVSMGGLLFIAWTVSGKVGGGATAVIDHAAPPASSSSSPTPDPGCG
jgi:hypothetical protein